MGDSVYRVTEVIGVEHRVLGGAPRSNAVETAGEVGARPARGRGRSGRTSRSRTASVTSYRVRLGISFKYDSRGLKLRLRA